MIQNVLLDTGPLIALIDHRDRHHDWVQSQFAKITPPLLTCDAVLTEACYLARRTDGGIQAVLELIEREVIRLDFDLAANFANVARLILCYPNVPMSLADACLVRMSETITRCTVFTLDSDFHIYRRNGRQTIPILIPM